MNDFAKKVAGLTSKKATQIPVTAQTQRRGKYSVNIVCAKGNRKSVTLSKALADQLALIDHVYITVYKEDGCIILSPSSVNEYSANCSFSNDKDRMIYNALLVHFIADTFELDYTAKTSMSFSTIHFDSIDDMPIAVVMMRNDVVTDAGDTSEGQVLDSDS